nr:MAG TPA: hypothetical protein [Caudoviricetes sp.]
MLEHKSFYPRLTIKLCSNDIIALSKPYYIILNTAFASRCYFYTHF